MFAEVRKSGLQGCCVREKGSVSQNVTRAWGKNVSEKLQGQEGEKTKKRSHKDMQYITFTVL